MSKEFNQLPRRILRRQGGFYGEDDCLPNEDSAPDSVPAIDPQPSKSAIVTRRSRTHNHCHRRFCRICLSDEADDNSKGQLCSPCRCRGSMRYVHRVCLEEWKNDQIHLQEPMQCQHCLYSYPSSRMSLPQKVAHWVYVITLTCALFYAYVVLYGLPMKLFVHILDLSNDSVIYVAEGTQISIRRAYELVQPMTLRALYTVDTTHLLLGLILFGIISAAGYPGFGLMFMSLVQYRAPPLRQDVADIRATHNTFVMIALCGAFKGVYDLYNQVEQSSPGRLPTRRQITQDMDSQ